ncbi:MAG: hypothetical protein R3B70_09860 [Polyangiaceae bacterium]
MALRLPLSSLVAAGALALATLCPRPASAGDFRLNVSLSGAGSEWRDDGAVWGGLGLGYRFFDLVGVYALGRLGYGSVDQRMLTLLALGAQIWGRLGPTRPYARIAFIHQHEEPVAAVEQNVGGAVFGVGDGIRHRAGAEGALGLDWTFYEKLPWSLFANAEASFAGLPNSSGPGFYVLGSVGLGVHYTL